MVHAQVAQLVPVGHVARAGHDLQVRKALAHAGGDLQRLLGRVHRDDQHPRLVRAGNAQQVHAGGIAEEHAVAEGVGHFQHLHAVVEDGGRHALGQQHARHDLAVAAKARNDDLRVLRLRYFMGPGSLARAVDLAILHVGKALEQQLVHQHQHQRADQHGQGHGGHQHGRDAVVEHLVLRRRLEHHEGELAALGQQQGEHRALAPGQLQHAGQGVEHGALERQKAQHHGRHGPGRAAARRNRCSCPRP